MSELDKDTQGFDKHNEGFSFKEKKSYLNISFEHFLHHILFLFLIYLYPLFLLIKMYILHYLLLYQNLKNNLSH